MFESLRNWIADKLRVGIPATAAQHDEIHRELHTLDHWRAKLSGLPRTIECSVIELLSSGSHEPYFTGPGRIEIRSETEIRFFVYGTAKNGPAAFRKLIKARENPYDPLEQFQVHATDYQGVEWAGGWSPVDYFDDAKEGWPLTGELQGLATLATGPWVSKRSSVELLLVPPIDLPTTKALVTVSRIGDKNVRSIWEAGEQSVSLLGTTIHFTYEQGGEALWITADTSSELGHPFAENWLTEPLRILLGITVYPRMVARNLGDGTAHVWLRPAPAMRESSAVGLLQPFALESGRREAFWKLYADILTMIAKAGSFDAHPLTHLYVELAHAQHGSRWVITLMLASTVEALAGTLMTAEDRKSEFSDALLQSMKTHLRVWKDDIGLRDRMLSNLGLVSKRSVMAFMQGLAARGFVNSDHVQTWSKVRNSVMHGEMVEPWSSEEGDARMNELLQLVHALSRARIAKG